MDRKESGEGKTVANKAVPNHISWVWGSGQLPTASTFNFLPEGFLCSPYGSTRELMCSPSPVAPINE